MALSPLKQIFGSLFVTVGMMSALVVVPTHATTAYAVTAADLIKAVETKYKSVAGLRASFTQISRNAVFGDETVTGIITVKRPAKMRWEFGKDKLFITNGSKLWIYTVADKQVIQYDDLSSGQTTAESLLGSLDKLTSMFKITVVKSDATGNVLDMIPNEEGQFKRVRLTLDAALLIKQVIITDTFDNVTEMNFTAVQLNPAIDDAIFEFRVPAGVDVVRATTN